MKRYLEAYITLFLFVAPILILDQWTKSLVRANLDFMEIWVPWAWLEPYARIVHWKNTGAAFGMLQQFGDVFKILAIVVSIGIVYFFPQVPRRDWLLRLALAMQMGGALGNLIDRLTQGWVTDFISVGNFAVFNIADASISVGVVVLLLAVWLKERREAAQTVKESQVPPTSPAEHSGE